MNMSIFIIEAVFIKIFIIHLAHQKLLALIFFTCPCFAASAVGFGFGALCDCTSGH